MARFVKSHHVIADGARILSGLFHSGGQAQKRAAPLNSRARRARDLPAYVAGSLRSLFHGLSRGLAAQAL